MAGREDVLEEIDFEVFSLLQKYSKALVDLHLSKDHAFALKVVEELNALATSGVLRDVDFTTESFCKAFNRLVLTTLNLPPSSPVNEEKSEEQRLQEEGLEFVRRVVGFPEFANKKVEATVCDYSMAQCAFHYAERRPADSAAPQPNQNLICTLLYKCYVYGSAENRKRMRQIIGGYLQKSARVGSKARANSFAVRVSLKLAGSIIKGLHVPLRQVNALFFNDLLLPLHAIPGKVSHLTPVLALIHQPLLYCVIEFIKKQPNFVASALTSVLKFWPTLQAGNSQKEVLLLHELEALLELESAMEVMTDPGHRTLRGRVFRRMATSLESDHSMVCERVLLLWRNETVLNLFACAKVELLTVISRPLLSRALSHWNETVVKISVAVLKIYFQDEDTQELLVTLAQEIWSEKEQIDSTKTRDKIELLISEMDAALQAEEEEAKAETVQVGTSVPEKQEDTNLMNMVFSHELGVGSFGKVFLAMKVEKEKPRAKWKKYAVKQIPKEQEAVATREAKMMDMVNHPNCTRLIALYTTMDYINLVIEYASKGDLHGIIANLGSLDVPSAKFIAAEVASALGAFHAKELVFGDLKPENVLIHENGHAKLGDYGATRHVSEVTSGARMEGTLVYLAPEIVEGNAGGFTIDWWAFGCLIYQMIAGRPPLWVQERDQLQQKLVNFKVEDFPAGFTTDATHVVQALLTRSPDERLGQGGLDEIQRHTFFRDIDINTAHTLAAPQLSAGTVKVTNGPWTQRTYSMIYAPLPQKYEFDLNETSMMPIVEREGEELPWLPQSDRRGSRSGKSSSRRFEEIPVPKKSERKPGDMEKYAASYLLSSRGTNKNALAGFTGPVKPLSRPGIAPLKETVTGSGIQPLRRPPMRDTTRPGPQDLRSKHRRSSAGSATKKKDPEDP